MYVKLLFLKGFICYFIHRNNEKWGVVMFSFKKYIFFIFLGICLCMSKSRLKAAEDPGSSSSFSSAPESDLPVDTQQYEHRVEHYRPFRKEAKSPSVSPFATPRKGIKVPDGDVALGSVDYDFVSPATDKKPLEDLDTVPVHVPEQQMLTFEEVTEGYDQQRKRDFEDLPGYPSDDENAEQEWQEKISEAKRNTIILAEKVFDDQESIKQVVKTLSLSSISPDLHELLLFQSLEVEVLKRKVASLESADIQNYAKAKRELEEQVDRIEELKPKILAELEACKLTEKKKKELEFKLKALRVAVATLAVGVAGIKIYRHVKGQSTVSVVEPSVTTSIASDTSAEKLHTGVMQGLGESAIDYVRRTGLLGN